MTLVFELMFGPCRVYVTTDDAMDVADSAIAQVLFQVKQALVRRSQFEALQVVEQLSFVTERSVGATHVPPRENQ